MNNKPTVLIIGGTSGIGFATAIRFADDHNVIIIGRDSEKGFRAQKLPKITFLQCDISLQSQREKLLKDIRSKNIGKIVHCAGIFIQSDNKTYQEEYRAVKSGGIQIIKQLLLDNTITHVCATSSLYTFLPDTIVPVFEKSIQQKLEVAILSISGNVVVNCIAPGLTNTPLVQKAYGEEGIKKVLSLAPGSRVVQPEEVAETIYWLSNQNTITHSLVPIDGGFLQSFYGNQTH